MQCQLPLSALHKWAAASPQNDNTAASIPFGCGLADEIQQLSGEHIFLLHNSILFLAVMLQPKTMPGHNTSIDSELRRFLVTFPTKRVVKGPGDKRGENSFRQRSGNIIYNSHRVPKATRPSRPPKILRSSYVQRFSNTFIPEPRVICVQRV